MPEPVYIICSESGAIDESTNLPSMFNVFDELRVSLTPATGDGPAHSILQMLSVRVTSLWKRSRNEDESQEFEHQLVMRRPGVKKEDVLNTTKFRFTKPQQRFVGMIKFAHPFAESGMLRFESRVRRLRGKWRIQGYDVSVVVTKENGQETKP